MEEMLKTYLANPDEGDFKMVLQSRSAKGGETEMTLYGDTGYRFWSTETKGNKKVEYAGYREQRDFLAFFQTLLDSRFWDGASTGETTVTLSAEGKSLSVSIPTNATHPGCRAALAAIDGQIRDIAKEVVR